jgi:hypothetical protein
MAAVFGWTNKGAFRALAVVFRGATAPTNFYAALVATTPTADTNVMSDLTEMAAGNGYTSGGYQLSRNSTDFDVLTEDDANDKAFVQIKDIPWTASGGAIPASGSVPTYLVITDDNATVANREVWCFLPVTVVSTPNGAILTVKDSQIELVNA